MRRDHAPLSVGQIGLVSGDGAAMLLSSGRHPHGGSKLVRESPWNGGRQDSTIFKLPLTRARGLNFDIDGWLRSLGLEQYAAAFRDNAIDEKVLPRLTAEDLKDLGVGLVGHRRTLLEAIAALRADANANACAPFGTSFRAACGARCRGRRRAPLPHGDVLRSRGFDGRYGCRLRIGDWRVIFIEDVRYITVIAVGNRKEIYD